MIKKILGIIFFAAIGIAGFTISVFFLKIHTFKYSEIVSFFLKNYQGVHKFEHFDTQFFPPQNYPLFKFYFLFLSLFSFIGTLLILLNKKKVLAKTKLLITELEQLKLQIYGFSWLKEDVYTFGIICIVILFRLYFLSSFCFYVDEVFSYVNFVDKGFMLTSTYYPEHNNHVFYNIVCVVLNKIQILSPVWVMRLPSFLSGVVILFVLYIFCSRKIGANYSLIVIILIGFLPSASVFSIQGRGYSMVALFTLVLYICRQLEGKKCISNLVYLILGILSFYVLPSFIYPFIGLIFYKIIHSFIDKKKLILILEFIIIVVVIVIYWIPLVAFSGYKLILSSNSQFRFIIDTTNFSVSYKEFDLALLPGYGYVTLINIVLLPALYYINEKYIASKGYRNILLFFLSNVFILFLIFLFQTIDIPARTWTYFHVLNCLVFAILLRNVFQVFPQKFNHVVIGVFLGISIFYSFQSYHYLSKNLYFTNYNECMESADKVATKLCKNATKIYCENDEVTTYIKLRAKELGKSDILDTAFNDCDYKVLNVENIMSTNECRDVNWDYGIKSTKLVLAKVYVCK